MVDSSFFWGYLVTQIPGGFLASFFPANRIFGIAIFTSALLNMTLPGAMSLDSITVLIMIRVLQGLVEVRNYKTKYIFYNRSKFPVPFHTIGCGVSGLSRNLAFLGAAPREIPFSHDCILWFLCWYRVWNAIVGIFGAIYRLASTILFLFNLRCFLVFCLALVSIRKAQSSSDHRGRRDEIY